MRKSSVLKIISLAAFAMAGGFAIANASSSKKANAVAADGEASTISIYCTKSFDFLNNAISVHQWGGTTAGTEWPGTPMEHVYDNNMDQPVYKLDIPSDRTGLIFVSWQGSDLKQTVDVESSTGFANNSAWYFSGWSGNNMTVSPWSIYPYTINYHGNGSTSGSMASETGYDDVAWGLEANEFEKTGYTFVGWNTEADGSGTPYSNSALIASGTMSGASLTTLDLYAQWEGNHTEGRYIVGEFADCDWDIEHAQLMANVNKEKDPWEYDDSITLAYGDKFKSAYWVNASYSFIEYFGYSDLDATCNAYHYFGHDESDNIVCVARGTYHIYFEQNSYDNGTSISIVLTSTPNAEHLAALLMGADLSEGTCKDRFPAMKTMFLGLSDGEKLAFQGYAGSEDSQFSGAYERYMAWATALHEKPWEEGKTSGAPYIANGSDSNNLIVIVSIVSLVSVSTLVGLIVIKRRRGIAK